MSEVVEITYPDPPVIEFFALQGAKGEPGTRIVGFSIGDGVALISPGVKFSIQIPFACAITSWTLMGAPSGSIVVDLWKTTWANHPGSVADSITAAAKPTVVDAVKATSSTLTGWTTAVAAGDVLTSNVEAGATMRRATLQLVIIPTS